MNYLIYITAFILGVICGHYLKKCPLEGLEIDNTSPSHSSTSPSTTPYIKVFPKAQPTTYEEKRLRAIKDNKPIIKTFHK